MELIQIDKGEERKFYEVQSIKNTWGRNKLEVHYALVGLDNRIFVAEYKTKLPSEEKIRKKLEQK